MNLIKSSSNVVNSIPKKAEIVRLFKLLIFLFLYFPTTCCSQSDDYHYSCRENKFFKYRSYYLDSNSNILLSDSLSMYYIGKKKWFWLSMQRRIVYEFYTETANYNLYQDPELGYQLRDQKYFEKKGRYRISTKEKTGGYICDNYFWIHPPRVNQFRYLDAMPYLYVDTNALSDSIETAYKGGITYFDLKGVNDHYYTANKIDTVFHISEILEIS